MRIWVKPPAITFRINAGSEPPERARQPSVLFAPALNMLSRVFGKKRSANRQEKKNKKQQRHEARERRLRLVKGAGPSEEPVEGSSAVEDLEPGVPPQVYDEEMLEHSMKLASDKDITPASSRGHRRGLGKRG
jgi:hypothetical protein